MYLASARMRTELNRSHRVIARAEVWRGGKPLTPLLTVISGTVTTDATATVEQSGTITCLDEHGLLSRDLATQILDVYTAELQLYRGVRYEDGSEEVVPTGRYRMSKLKIGMREGAVTFDATLLDRSAACQGSLPSPLAIPANTTVEAAIPQVLSQVMPELTYRLTASHFTLTAQIIDSSKQPWNEAQGYATSAGMRLFMDRTGVCTMTPINTVSTGNVAWNYIDGQGNCLVDPDRIMSNDDVHNVVIVNGSNPAAPGITARAQDDNPMSPTYRAGPFGSQVKVIDDPRIATQAQAQAEANAQLIVELGPGETIEFDAPVNPLLDVYDTVAVYKAALGIASLYSVQKLERPFAARDGLMHVTANRAVGSVLPVIGPAATTPPVLLFPDLIVTEVEWRVE